MVRKLLGTPLIFVLLTWIWNHAMAIGTIIMKIFLIHEHWKHFQCFHRKICTVVINGLLLLPPPPPPPPLLFIVDTILKFFLLFHIKIYLHSHTDTYTSVVQNTHTHNFFCSTVSQNIGYKQNNSLKWTKIKRPYNILLFVFLFIVNFDVSFRLTIFVLKKKLLHFEVPIGFYRIEKFSDGWL